MTYEATGNILTNSTDGTESARNSQSRGYDYENRLAKNVDNGATTFVYNSQGARVKKISGSSTTIYIGKLYEKTNGVVTRHIFAGGRRIATKTGSETFYYHPDHLGSLSVATDHLGNQRQAVTYYPFGAIRTNTGTVDLPFKFTGQEYDPETGLYYFGARYYDPAMGRFITPDSIVQSPGDPQSLNRYAYCRNNPLMLTDPTGHDFGLSFFIGMLAVFGSSIAACFNGGSPISAMALGTVTAGLFFGAGQISGAMASSLGVTSQVGQAAISSGVHFAAGMCTGMLSGAVNHQDILKSAITSGLSAGVARGLGGVLEGTDWFKGLDPTAKFAVGLASHSAIGAVTGGIGAEMMGGNFGQEAAQGAWTSAFGYVFNQGLHSLLETAQPSIQSWQGNQISSGDWRMMGWDRCPPMLLL